MDLKKLDEILKDEPSYRLKQIKRCLYIDLIDDWRNATTLSKELREKLSRDLPISIEGESFVSEDNQTIKYYLKDNGNVYQSSFDGSNLKAISTAELKDLYQIIWSPDKQKVISIYKNVEGIKKYVYDYSTKKAALLADEIKGLDFSPDSQKIAYQFVGSDGQSNNLSVADFDGTNWRNILATRLESLVVDWPSPAKIYFKNTPAGQTAGSLFSLNPASGSFNKLLADLYGFSAIWSSGGLKMAWSATDQGGKNLKLYSGDNDGTNAKQLPIATIAEKCVWSINDQDLFCAVPQKISQDDIWPDDYFKGKVFTIDDFYLINTATGNAEKIAVSDTSHPLDAQNLILSPQEDYLFFINRQNGLLYNMKLTP